MILEARDLTVRYPGAADPALADAQIAVGPGELVALVGPNGSGKTTLLRAVLGIVPLASGECRILGRPLSQWVRNDLAKAVGVVTQQEERVFPLKVSQSVALGRYPHLAPLAPLGEEDVAAVERAMSLCDVNHLADRSTDTLSGGEWQRVRVARALAQQPTLMVLDEPTSELDIRHEMEVFELVKRLAQQEGMGLLVITHHLNLAGRYASELVLLSRGQVAARGRPSEVLTADNIERVFGWPVTIQRLADGAPQVIPLTPRDQAGPLTNEDRG